MTNNSVTELSAYNVENQSTVLSGKICLYDNRYFGFNESNYLQGNHSIISILTKIPVQSVQFLSSNYGFFTIDPSLFPSQSILINHLYTDEVR